MTLPPSLETHCLNRRFPRLAPRPPEPDIMHCREWIRGLIEKKLTAESPFPRLSRQRIHLVVDVGPESAYYSLRHIPSGAVWAIGVTVWGQARAAYQAHHWIFNRYLWAILNDPEGVGLREASAPLVPENVPFAAVAYLAPFYRHVADEPPAARLLEETLDLVAYSVLERAGAAKDLIPRRLEWGK